MGSPIAAFPDLESSVVVTTLALPTPQNPTASVVSTQTERNALDRMQATQLDAVVQKNKNITGLFSEYLRWHSECANSSLAVTYTVVFPIQMPKRYEVPARRTPFAHLNFLAPPVEGLYIDPDDPTED